MTQYILKSADTLANIKQDAKKLVPTKAKSLRYFVGKGKVAVYDKASNLETLHGINATIEFSSLPLAVVQKDKKKFVPLTLKGYETKPEAKPAKAKKVKAKKPKAGKPVKTKLVKTKATKKPGAKKSAKPAKVKTVKAPAAPKTPKVKTGITADIDAALSAGKYTLREGAAVIAAKYPDKKPESIYQICANRVRVRKLQGMPPLAWKPSQTGGGFMLLIDELFDKGGKTFNEMVQAVLDKFPTDAKGKKRDFKKTSHTMRNRVSFLRQHNKPVRFLRTETRHDAEYIAGGVLDNSLLATSVNKLTKASPKKKAAVKSKGGKKK